MSFWKTIRKIERIRFLASMLVIGLLFVVVGAVVLSLPKTEYSSAEGTILRIESYTDGAGEEQQEVYVSYKDSAGVNHEDILYPAYSFSMKEGGTVTVLYDPASPENIQAPGGEYIPYIVLAVGIIAIAVAVFSIIKGKQKAESASPFEASPEAADPAVAEQIQNDGEPAKEYYFHWTGKLNQSYILETPSRQSIYEANCDHMGVLTPYRYTFVDRLTGVSREHKVSHTVTKSYGRDMGDVSVSAVASSDFKIDDVNNWEYLKKLGYSVVPRRAGLKMNFDVLRQGVPVAYLEAAGTNILKDEGKSFLGDKLTGTGLYKVTCKTADLEGVFTACFCLSRVEFYE